MHTNPPSASARLGAGTAAAVVVAVAHVVSECCVRASNFMKTNPLQNKRAKESERPTHGLESGSDRGKKGEYIRAASRVSISERGSWEIKAFNYMEEERERVEARFVIEINSRPFYPKLSLLRRLLVRTAISFPGPTEQEARYSPTAGQAQKRPGKSLKQNMHRYFLEGGDKVSRLGSRLQPRRAKIEVKERTRTTKWGNE